MADKIATREAYGDALVALADKYDFVVLDADLAEATKTVKFKKAHPERFFDCGIAEGNMMSVAAGIATTGKTVFASSFAMFAAGRAFEQVRNSIGYPHLNVKIGATHAGITVGEDGATHQCNEDIALMRTIPGMTIVNPADAVEARAADGTDVTIVATGLMVSVALEARAALAAEGISARVINIHTIKPLDGEILAKAAKETGAIVTAEEHNIIGGLGSAVAESVSQSCPVPVVRVGVKDVYGHSGTVPALLEAYGLTAANLVAAAKAAVAKKSPAKA